jgi:hypothetical protein
MSNCVTQPTLSTTAILKGIRTEIVRVHGSNQVFYSNFKKFQKHAQDIKRVAMGG